MKRGTWLAAGTLTLAASALWAQSSPNYQVTNAGTVATAGEATSPQFAATVSGGDGAPSQPASSLNYGVVLGSGDPDPLDAEEIFVSSFEGRPR